MPLFIIAYRRDLSFRIGGCCEIVDQIPGVLRGVAQGICITGHVALNIVTVGAYAAQDIFRRQPPVHDVVGVDPPPAEIVNRNRYASINYEVTYLNSY